ncbi:MAG: CBS domain-containing protein [Acidobacteria bacterium]|nr:CBS domain-containing protein [Acidobacteriota bacterium]
MIYFTEIQNLPAYDVRGAYLGRIIDLGIDPSQNALRVAAYLVQTRDKNLVYITRDQLQSISVRAAQTSVTRSEVYSNKPSGELLLVKKDVLDQQVIDVNHRKVVRVNDVDLDIHPINGHTELRVLAVNVGLAAAVRRLLQGLTAKHTSRKICAFIPSRAIRWEFINLIEPDASRRLKLRISYERLARLHPADIADILEDLSRDEQRSVIETLDRETAAQAISEIPISLQATLLESIPPEKASDIIDEMAPDEAADVLQELPRETSAQLLAGMEKEGAEEIKDLLGFEEDTAGALMTTHYVALGEDATVENVIEAMKQFEGTVESVHAVYLVSGEEVLTGAVPIARILLAPASTPLRELSREEVISITTDADAKSVVDLFRKYNLLALPVVDDKRHLVGVVTADDVLDLVVNRRR